MNRLVNDLLSLSRVESEERVRPTDHVNLDEIVLSVCNILESNEHGVAISLLNADRVWKVTGDADQLVQVFSNLIENALKYGGDGGRIEVRFSQVERDPFLRAAAIQVDVADFGAGIAPVHLHRLTERFYRADNHRSRELGGTGLGWRLLNTSLRDIADASRLRANQEKAAYFGRFTRTEPRNIILQPSESCGFHRSSDLYKTVTETSQKLRETSLSRVTDRLGGRPFFQAGDANVFRDSGHLFNCACHLGNKCCARTRSDPDRRIIDCLAICGNRRGSLWENFDHPTPVVESGGSSAGLKKFCEGVGEHTIDIANSSRKIREREVSACAQAGVSDILEVRFGYDGIVFASDINGASFEFTPAQWFNALSEQVVIDGKVVDNPYTMWSEIDVSLPTQKIAAFIPGTKHGTREVFEDKVILAGCEESGAFDVFMAAASGDKTAAQKACISVRTDGVSVDIDGDYTETLARIESNRDAIGVFGLSFYENTSDKLQVATMSGVAPSTNSISTGVYPVSRPLFFYIKKAHLEAIPGLKDYAQFFVSDEVSGPDGPLAEYGLVSDPKLAITQEAVEAETTIGTGM